MDLCEPPSYLVKKRTVWGSPCIVSVQPECAPGRLACDCLCLPCEALPISDEETWGAARRSFPPTWSRVLLGSFTEQLNSLFPNWVPQPPRHLWVGKVWEWQLPEWTGGRLSHPFVLSDLWGIQSVTTHNWTCGPELGCSYLLFSALIDTFVYSIPYAVSLCLLSRGSALGWRATVAGESMYV